MKNKQLVKLLKKQFKGLKTGKNCNFKDLMYKIIAFLKTHFSNMENIVNVKLINNNNVVVFMVLFQVSTNIYTWSIEL